MDSKQSNDHVSVAIERATVLVDEARQAVLQLDITRAKSCLLEATSILEEARRYQH